MRRLVAVFFLTLGSIAPAAADELFHCVLTEAGGISAAEAGTAVGLICDDLRRESGGRGAFEIRLGTLGSLVNVTATRLDTGESISVRAGGLEEVPLASARIAEALVHHRTLVSTQRVDNLLEEETREARVKRGSVKFTLGVADLESIGHGARGAGFSLGLTYATPRFALPAEMRFAWDDNAYPEPGMNLFSVSLGGRGYLSKRDVSPFVGGGLGLLWLDAHGGRVPLSRRARRPATSRPTGSASLPTSRRASRCCGSTAAASPSTSARTFPLAALQSEEIDVWSEWDPPGSAPRVYPAQSRYVVPVSIGISVAF